MSELRDYQVEASDKVDESWSTGHRSPLIVMATGLGKTRVGLHKAHDFPGRVLWLAHSKELVYQPQEEYAERYGEWPEIEMGQWKANKKLLFHKCHVVISTPQTMRNRIKSGKWHPKDFDFIVADEAHHYVNNSWGEVLDHFMSGNPNCRMLGLTATPKRSDELAMGIMFDDSPFIRDAVWGFENGWLKPPDEFMVHIDDIDLSDLKVREGHDFSDRQLGLLFQRTKAHLKAAKPIIDHNMHTIVFVPPKSADDEHGMVRELANVLNGFSEERGDPHKAFYVTCNTQPHVRDSLLRQFKTGDLKYFVNVNIAGEGFDAPLIDCVASLRPTNSETVYLQQVGRGMRPLPGVVDGITSPQDRVAAIAGSASPRLLVLDFVGNCGKHRVMTLVDVLGGRYDDDVVKAAVETARAAGRKVNVAKLLEWSAKKAIEEKQRQMSEAVVRKVTADVKYTLRRFDPFAIMGIAQEREPGWFKGQSITISQRDTLLRAKVEPERIAGMSKHKASQLIGAIIEARKNGEASYPQAKLLARYGEPVFRDGRRLKYEEAHALIDRIAANGWRPLR